MGGFLGGFLGGTMGEQIGGSQTNFPQAVVQLQELVERSEALPQEPTRREVKSYAPRAAFPYKASCFSFCLKALVTQKKNVYQDSSRLRVQEGVCFCEASEAGLCESYFTELCI